MTAKAATIKETVSAAVAIGPAAVQSSTDAIHLSGSDHGDVLVGTAGNDLMNGGPGDDILTGGVGADILRGGLGADHFVYTALADSTVAVAGQDVITDFSHAQGDLIDLSAISPDFALVAVFTHHADQLIELARPGGFLIQGDVNGDGRPDFAIFVDGTTPLVQSDLIL